MNETSKLYRHGYGSKRSGRSELAESSPSLTGPASACPLSLLVDSPLLEEMLAEIRSHAFRVWLSLQLLKQPGLLEQRYESLQPLDLLVRIVKSQEEHDFHRQGRTWVAAHFAKVNRLIQYAYSDRWRLTVNSLGVRYSDRYVEQGQPGGKGFLARKHSVEEALSHAATFQQQLRQGNNRFDVVPGFELSDDQVSIDDNRRVICSTVFGKCAQSQSSPFCKPRLRP